ncbi:GAF domain-containing protein [Rubripirellula amarantea]|nr:GAF domain-containing protein [Rubripirellula amarantea]
MSVTLTTKECVDPIYELSLKIVAGATLEESLDYVFEAFEHIVPYDRISYAEVDETETLARARWARSRHSVLLRTGYAASLKHSSLSVVLKYRQPRVLNNLPEYLEHRPNSRSTELMVKEGIRSSMTCPLFVRDRAIGLLFFSSTECDTYDDSHVSILKDISVHLAMLLMASQPTAPQIDLLQVECTNDDLPTSISTTPSETTPPEPTVSETKVSQTAGDPEPIAAKPANVRKQDALLFSQLKPGMKLAEPVRFGNRGLLLASDTELTQLSIDRLVALRQQGIVTVSAVRVVPGT